MPYTFLETLDLLTLEEDFLFAGDFLLDFFTSGFFDMFFFAVFLVFFLVIFFAGLAFLDFTLRFSRVLVTFFTPFLVDETLITFLETFADADIKLKGNFVI